MCLQVQFDLLKYDAGDEQALISDILDTTQAINGIKGSLTRTDLAIKKFREMCLQSPRDGISCAGVVVTDGHSTDPTLTSQQASLTHDQFVLLAVGIDGADATELETIASGPGNTNTFTVTDVQGLLGVVSKVVLAACDPGRMKYSQTQRQTHLYTERLINPLEGVFGIEGHVALDRNSGPRYCSLL